MLRYWSWLWTFLVMIMTSTKKHYRCDTRMWNCVFSWQILPNIIVKSTNGVENNSSWKPNLYICSSSCCVMKIVGVNSFSHDRWRMEKTNWITTTVGRAYWWLHFNLIDRVYLTNQELRLSKKIMEIGVTQIECPRFWKLWVMDFKYVSHFILFLHTSLVWQSGLTNLKTFDYQIWSILSAT